MATVNFQFSIYKYADYQYEISMLKPDGTPYTISTDFQQIWATAKLAPENDADPGVWQKTLNPPSGIGISDDANGKIVLTINRADIATVSASGTQWHVDIKYKDSNGYERPALVGLITVEIPPTRAV